MKIVELELPEVLLVQPEVFGDDRGFFLESWNAHRFHEQGFPENRFVQDNHSRSCGGVLRGLHFQRNRPQGKLVRVVRGRVFDVAVDIRAGSPRFGCWIGYELDDQDHVQLWVPPGFAHGFCALTDTVDLTYKCSDYYRPQDDAGIIWNDAHLDINWPIDKPQLSAKDSSLPTLAEAEALGILPRYVS